MSYGESTLDINAIDGGGEHKNSMWTVGAYHPITKHLNLVAEYNHVEGENDGSTVLANNTQGKAKTIALGAILFF
jgi:hypothetical protein